MSSNPASLSEFTARLVGAALFNADDDEEDKVIKSRLEDNDDDGGTTTWSPVSSVSRRK